jgi:hypothetical protein
MRGKVGQSAAIGEALMALLRIVNAFYAALFLVMALVSIAFLSAGLNDRIRDPVELWLSIGWAMLFLLYAGLVFRNMRRAGADGPKDRLIAINVAAAAPMLAGLFADGVAGRFLCGVAILPFALTAGMLLTRRGGTPG